MINLLVCFECLRFIGISFALIFLSRRGFVIAGSLGILCAFVLVTIVIRDRISNGLPISIHAILILASNVMILYNCFRALLRVMLVIVSQLLFY